MDRPVPPSTLVALDTNFLLDLTVPTERAQDLVELFRRRVKNVEFVAPPTVLTELAHLADKGATFGEKKMARLALTSLVRVWKFHPLDFIPVGHGIIEQVARRLRGHGMIPLGEINDSLIVAEAALANCTLLVTSDRHLLEADSGLLRRELVANDVEPIAICAPRDLLFKFK